MCMVDTFWWVGLQPQLWPTTGISSVALVLVSRDKRSMSHNAKFHFIWSSCSNLRVDNRLRICKVDTCQWAYVMVKGLLLAGSLFHIPEYHNGLVSSRNGHVCLCNTITGGGSWCGRWRSSYCLHCQSHVSRALSHSRLLHRGELDPCAGNNSGP